MVESRERGRKDGRSRKPLSADEYRAMLAAEESFTIPGLDDEGGSTADANSRGDNSRRRGNDKPSGSSSILPVPGAVERVTSALPVPDSGDSGASLPVPESGSSGNSGAKPKRIPTDRGRGEHGGNSRGEHNRDAGLPLPSTRDEYDDEDEEPVDDDDAVLFPLPVDDDVDIDAGHDGDGEHHASSVDGDSDAHGDDLFALPLPDEDNSSDDGALHNSGDNTRDGSGDDLLGKLTTVDDDDDDSGDGERSHTDGDGDNDNSNGEIEYDPITGKIKNLVITHDANYTLTIPGDDAMLDFDIDDILEYGIDLGASDVHIYPERRVTYRINGDMYKSNRFRMVDGVKLDEVTQDGRWMNQQQLSEFRERTSVDYGYSLSQSTQMRHPGERFRVHWGQTMDYPYAVYRHINPEIFTPEQIGLTQKVVDWGWVDQGLILVTGPTGSGKSATLAALLREVQLKRSVKICTLEAPIETIYPSNGIGLIQQRGIPDDCLTFEDGIRDAMREDPDVLLIGEIRDKDTLDAALEACNTGHLTFATLHANSTADIISRIYSWFDPSEIGRIQDELSHNLKGALAQRLIKNADGTGRTAIREYMFVDETIQKLIAGNDINGIKKYLHKNNNDMPRQFLQMLLKQETTLDQSREILSGVELSMFQDDYNRTPENLRRNIIKTQPTK